jgi:hypothetical protein
VVRVEKAPCPEKSRLETLDPWAESGGTGGRVVAWAVAPGIGSVAQSNDHVKDREGGHEQSTRLIVYKGSPSAGSRPVRRRNAAAGRGGCLRRGSRRGESIRVGSVAFLGETPSARRWGIVAQSICPIALTLIPRNRAAPLDGAERHD